MTASGGVPIGGDLSWVLDEAERREMRARFVRSITTRGNSSGPPVEGSPLVVEVVVPSHGLRNDTYAICEFAERDSVRQLVSIQFQARTGRALLKADLSAFPLAEVEDDLTGCCRTVEQLTLNRSPTFWERLAIFLGRSMRRLARTATGRSCFTSLSCTASCAHTPQPRARHTSSSLTAKNATRSVMTGLRRSLPVAGRCQHSW